MEMASITERRGRFRARVRRDGYPTACKTFISKAAAAAWARQVEVAMESGKWTAPAAAPAQVIPTFASALADYRKTYAAKLKGAATYAYWFDELAAWDIAGQPVNTVTPSDVSKLRDKMAEAVAPGTVVRKLGLLAGFFTWCLKDRGWIDRNPVHSVRKPRVNDARERVLSDDERRYLLTAARASRAKWLPDALVVLLHSAMRRGELCGLRVPDVDLSAATAHLADTKNGTARDVPLCPASLGALRNLAQMAADRDDDKIIPLSDSHAMSVAFRRALDKARASYRADCASSGSEPDPDFLADLRLHDARHTAVTAWASTGQLSIIELQRISGHRQISMLARYTNLKATDIAAKMARVAA
jgi:integrase